MISSGMARNLVAAGVAALAASFGVMDANPSLFLYDRFVCTEDHLRSTFQGKNIWIVGASSGIGAEMARQLSRHGANLVLSSRPSEKLDSVANDCQQLGQGSTVVIPLDMTSSDETMEHAVSKVQSILGDRQIDSIVLNAGRGQLAPATATSRAQTESMFAVNTIGPIALTTILLSQGLIQEGKGNHLVVTSSVGAKFGVPLSSSYASTKHALHGFYNSLAAENPWMRIDLVCPGPVKTNFHINHQDTGSKEPKPADTKAPVRELKMPVERCASLIISSMIMGKRGGERWIAEQPTLFGLYLNQFAPSLFQLALEKIGPVRLKAFQEGKNLYDPETWRRSNRK